MPRGNPRGIFIVGHSAGAQEVRKAPNGHSVVSDNLDYSDAWPTPALKTHGVGFCGISDLEGNVIVQGEMYEGKAYRKPRY